MQGWFRRAAAALAVLGFSMAAAAQSAYPNKPIKMVVPYPPGASTDAVARLVGQKVGEELGQPVVVDNKGGASGNIGSDFVAKAAPDGYTFLLATDATHTSNAHLFKNFPFDVLKDVTPITLAAKNILVLVAHPSFPPNNVRELIDYAKKNPGKVSYGSAGQGSPHHLSGAMLNQMAGIEMVHVPYKGGGPAATDVLGGQIPIIFSSYVTVAAQIQGGKLKVLGVTEKERYPGLPNVPTIAETLPGFEMSSWLGFFGPPNLPAPIVTRLHDSIVKALAAPDVAAKLDAAGLLVVGSTAQQFAAQQKADYEKRGTLIKAIGIQPE
ncbi:ABC transporter substrate-binding protein [Burkholderiales bacterium 8X]|nr:ABC transporter substrate-binding protein [Burkholderiales bacterium 8X]